MHYIRFLRTPKVEVKKGTVLLNAVITLTTDLGETFLPQDLELIATVRDTEQDGDIYLRRKLQWPGGARSLPVTFDLSRQDVDWPACMHIAVRNFGPVPPVGFLPPIVDVRTATDGKDRKTTT
ncbi:hypothetical protein B0A55_13558 [Friedmanniomyces simplex]|uniref:Arrestin-like N-terminal domain-containing protein n=1 Tax=Friedmanniomyces simplex TaxID=329884 RepID=A0A4U0UWF9_9PEZI|nr:hypothetical protein B0A55_13558 [Friedmanniomyces simplex]